MVGFQNVEETEGTVRAQKPGEVQKGPAKIKRKVKEENPWANLENADSNMINEDDLMKKGE